MCVCVQHIMCTSNNAQYNIENFDCSFVIDLWMLKVDTKMVDTAALTSRGDRAGLPLFMVCCPKIVHAQIFSNYFVMT